MQKVNYHDEDTIWFTGFKPNLQAQLRLFCFPHAGGGSSIFSSWTQFLPSAIELYPVQLPGRENRFKERPFTRLAPLIEALASILYPRLDRPFAFFGHSMGALISFELTRSIRTKFSLSPVQLFISGHPAPQLSVQDNIPHLLPEQAIEKVRSFGGTPETVLQNTELMQLIMPTLLADFELCRTYRYRSQDPLDCPISVFGGWEDPDVSQENLALWACQTRRSFILQMLPGNHFFFRSAQHLLLQSIARDLDLIRKPTDERCTENR